MSLGLVLIMLGAVLPDLKTDYALSYQAGGALLSVQSVGYVPAGLIAVTAGIGLGMSDMFGTSVSNAGDVFSRYPVCMGFFVFLTCMGAIAAPAIIGSVANTAGMHTGMSTLLVFAACMVAAAVLNLFMQGRGKR